MKLSQLIGRSIEADVDVNRLQDDSRKVAAGDVYVVDHRLGKYVADFVSMALENGAAAVLCDQETFHATAEDKRQKLHIVERPLSYVGCWALEQVKNKPQHLAAVTGTNGKTSIAWFFNHLVNAAGRKGASVGTLGVYTGGAHHGSTGFTSPAPLKLAEIMADLGRQHIDYACLEASSHALELGRYEGLRFQAAAFTNLTQDHMDFHGSADNYLAAKMRLFRDLMQPNGVAVVSTRRIENLLVMNLARECGLHLLTYGIANAELVARPIEADSRGMKIEVLFNKIHHTAWVPLMGAFQAENIAGALGLAIGCGIPLTDLLPHLETIPPVPGRMEMLNPGDVARPTIVIDYAHTPDGLETALKALRPMTKGKLWVVFGCGGDRDPIKRPQMGKLAAQLAHQVVITDDNPRTEEAAPIRRQILAEAAGAKEIADRAEAIAYAIGHAEAGDIVLIAGKGHETGQLVKGKVLPFSDIDEATRCLHGQKAS